jgi:U4/U6.U5 tri-snRNP-associated protein 3
LEEAEMDTEGKTEDEIAMMKLMGFSGFDSTKGKKVKNNDTSAVHHVVVRKYRLEDGYIVFLKKAML